MLTSAAHRELREACLAYARGRALTPERAHGVNIRHDATSFRESGLDGTEGRWSCELSADERRTAWRSTNTARTSTPRRIRNSTRSIRPVRKLHIPGFIDARHVATRSGSRRNT